MLERRGLCFKLPSMSIAVRLNTNQEKPMKLKDIIPKQLLPDALQEGEDAIDLLTADHERVKSLFEEFEEIKDGRANKEKKRIVTEACNELTLQAKVEEEIFYPAVRAAIDEDDLMNEARVEHATAKDLIRQLESMEPSDEMYVATFTVLREYIE